MTKVMVTPAKSSFAAAAPDRHKPDSRSATARRFQGRASRNSGTGIGPLLPRARRAIDLTVGADADAVIAQRAVSADITAIDIALDQIERPLGGMAITAA